MHTHWTRNLPSRWLLCTWLLASSCAILCSSARHLDPLFCFNLCGCVFGLQARRALRASSCKQGWIRKSRSAGGRRCKGHRRQKARRRLRAALQVCGWIWLLVCGCHGSSVTPVGYQAARLGHARGDPARGRRRREPRAAKGKVLRQTEIQAYFLLAPGEGGCLFYAVSTEVSGGQKWVNSAAPLVVAVPSNWTSYVVLISAGMASACKPGETCEKGVPKPRRRRNGTYTSKGPKSRAACRERQSWSAPSQEADADTPCGSLPCVATSTRPTGCSAT